MSDKKLYKIKIMHLITGLNTGGAETMLYKLLSKMDRDAFEAQVFSLMDIGEVGKKILKLDVPVQAMGMRQGMPNPLALLKLAYWLRQSSPHCMQTWMYHADLIGGLAVKLAKGIPVIWGIRHSNLDPTGTKKSTIWTAKACAWLSRWLPTFIVCCSEASRRVHSDLGYISNIMKVIPNGFDLIAYKPDPLARQDVCKELGINKGTLTIGLIARYNPQKDHHNFIKAAAKLRSYLPNVCFLLCGEGITWENPQLVKWIEEAGVKDNFFLLGRRADIPRLTAALDIASSSSSYGEGFPNVIGEAMACGVPCVVTNVGDSAYIVGDTGRVVPPRNHRALAESWRELIELGPEERSRLGNLARLRVLDNFNLPLIVSMYEDLYREVVASSSKRFTLRHF